MPFIWTRLKRLAWTMGLLLTGGCAPPHTQESSLLTPHSLWPHPSPQKPQTGVPSPSPSFEEIPLPFKKCVSLSIQANTSLKEALLELCQKEKISVVIHTFPEKSSSQTYTCFQKPFIQVLRDLCELAHIRFRLSEQTIHLEEDTPYIHTHTVPFPVGSRQVHNQINVLTNVLGSLEGYSPQNNSHTQLSGTTCVDFWGELEHVLQFILKEPSPSSQSIPSTALLSPSTPELPLSPLASDNTQRRTVRLLTTLPLEQREKPSKKKEEKPLSPITTQMAPHFTHYALHKQAGLISVYGTKRQHHLIHTYLERLKQLTHIQVTIEAQILEILLKENFKSGINWHMLGKHLNAQILGHPNTQTPFLTFGMKSGSFSGILATLSHFGTVRTLSNPRLTVLNNQPALMKVAKNEVFFQLEVDRVLSSDNKPDLETTTSRMQTIPIGLVLMVQPSVDPDTREITLALRPTLSRVVEMRNDPAVSIRSDNKIHSQVPVVQMRELDSVLKVQSHETVLMGGLMEKYQAQEKTGLPILHDTPLFDTLFSEKTEDSSTSELVIMLKVWIEEESTP